MNTITVRHLTALVVLTLFAGALLPLIQPKLARAAEVRQVSFGGANVGACIATPCGSIVYALSQAVAGDTIRVGAGTFIERITIDKNVEIIGSGSSVTFIDGGNAANTAITTGSQPCRTVIIASPLGRVITVSAGITTAISGMTIQNGHVSNFGGGISNFGTLTVRNSQVINNTADLGGGIHNAPGASLTISDSKINANLAESTGPAGGGIINDGQLTLTNTEINNNCLIAISTPGVQPTGGGIQQGGIATLEITNGQISDNSIRAFDNPTAGFGGGLFVENNSNVSIDGTVISNNDAGGLYIDADAQVVLQNTNLNQNRNLARNGGALFVGDGANVQLSKSKIINNIANASGGGIESIGLLTITDTIISGNKVITNFRGGGITAAGGTLSVSRSVISGHILGPHPSEGNGAGMVVMGNAIASISETTISGNVSRANGGGIYVASATASLSIERSTITNNQTLDSRPHGCFTGGPCVQGGGISANSTITITRSTISGNHSDGIGGGVFLGFGQATIDASTIVNNTAASSGGGILKLQTSATLRVANSIVASNTATDFPNQADCLGAVSGGGNIFGTYDASYSASCTPLSSDQSGSVLQPLGPRLGPLQINRGATATHALLAGSPALDTGGVCTGSDQRGISRPQGGKCDIGAYEADGASRLVFTSQPPSEITQNASLVSGGPIVVSVKDQFGNVASFNGPVTLSLRSGALPSEAQLVGQTSSQAVNGSATFSGSLTITGAGSGAVIVAGAPGFTDAESAPINVRVISLPPSEPFKDPDEPANNQIDTALGMIFDGSGNARYRALLSSTTDIDVLRFVARPNSTINLTLTHPSADYDLVLIRDPADVEREEKGIIDEQEGQLDLDAVVSLQRSTTPRVMVPRVMVPRVMVPKFAGDVDSLVIDATANEGTVDEQLNVPLPLGGTYYVAVLSTRGKSDLTAPYTLMAQLQNGDLREPSIESQPIMTSTLGFKKNVAVRVIYLANFARMRARYLASEQQAAIGTIQALLGPSEPLITTIPAIVLDVSTALGDPTDASQLNALYNQWDAAADQPLLANEVAKQLRTILISTIRTYFPNTTDVVLVGGDDVLPFYRVPDENSYGNEQGYLAGLKAIGSGIDLKSPLAASLGYGFIQTDNFYATRQTARYRGRSLFLPSLGIGRLVEQPADIARFLQAHNQSTSLNIQIQDGDGTRAAALVTGYDFLDDQAAALKTALEELGVDQVSMLTTLPGEPRWTSGDLTNRWFSGQLGKLIEDYSEPSTSYALTAINGHFNHFATEAADDGRSVFEASRLLTPTVTLGQEANAFFQRRADSHQHATLLYSIGCQSGLSATDGAFGELRYAADFASAVLKQGGNWIGNTGYGYADSQVVGYGERLAVLFTEELGRRGGVGEGTSVGGALARAKSRYVAERGVGNFSVSDEKVISGWTLYGLPFIRVLTPKPTPETPVPPVPVGAPVIKRMITLTATWLPDDRNATGSIPRARFRIQDSLDPLGAERTITTTAQGNWGAPVLPVLSVPLGIPGAGSRMVKDLPQLRGIRLLPSTSIPIQTGYDPRVTSPVTDTNIPQRVGERPLSLLGRWAPDLTYGSLRTLTDIGGPSTSVQDVLLVHPAQFRATSSNRGELWRFERIVFEITYLDPRTAPVALLNDQQPPTVTAPEISFGSAAVVAAGTRDVVFRVRASDSITPTTANDTGDALDVRVLYSADGVNWASKPLMLQGDSLYEAIVPFTFQWRGVFAYIQVGDAAGNVTTRIIDRSTSFLALPLIRR